MKITLIKTDGTTEQLLDQKLKTLQAAVGGYIEHIKVKGGSMYVNEEGRLTGLQYNALASQAAGQDIVGNAVLVTRK